jgi:hypothetical protein
MTSNPKYHRWFDLGATRFRGWAVANGFAHLLRDDPAVYPCPLCSRLFTKLDLIADRLTAADVPPKPAGGKPMLLTCAPCNNDRGGSKIDSHAAPRERFVDSQTGVRITPFKGEHTVGKSTARVDVWAGPGPIGIAYTKKRNNPNDFQAYKKDFANPSNVLQRISEDRGFSREKADLSYVRAAYLASFAVFGWAHIIRKAYVPLRRRLESRTTTTDLPAIVGYNVNRTSRENEILLVTEPGPQHGLLLVKMSRAMVALPGPRDERTLEDVAATLPSVLADGGGQRVEGFPIPWPTRPTHHCDREPPH